MTDRKKQTDRQDILPNKQTDTDKRTQRAKKGKQEGKEGRRMGKRERDNGEGEKERGGKRK